MNAKELRDLFASGRAYVARDGERLIDEATAREADAIAARALGLLAATEGEEGTADIAGLVEALGHQQQCDEDGVMCIVSRQAVDEASTMLASLAARVRELEEERCCTCRDGALKQPYSTMPPLQTLPWGTEK